MARLKYFWIVNMSLGGEAIGSDMVEAYENAVDDSELLMKLQEQSGFTQKTLADSLEDVWNEL